MAKFKVGDEIVDSFDSDYVDKGMTEIVHLSNPDVFTIVEVTDTLYHLKWSNGYVSRNTQSFVDEFFRKV